MRKKVLHLFFSETAVDGEPPAAVPEAVPEVAAPAQHVAATAAVPVAVSPEEPVAAVPTAPAEPAVPEAEAPAFVEDMDMDDDGPMLIPPPT